MAVPDFLRFEKGNPISAAFTGEWFETTGLFGYFEKYNVHRNGTIWLTPTEMVPTGRMQPFMVEIDHSGCANKSKLFQLKKR